MWLLHIPPVPLSASVSVQVPAPASQTIRGIKIGYRGSVSQDNQTGQITFSGEVSAEYEGTRLTCDSLTIDPQTKTGFTMGETHIDDPEGKITCGRLDFDWERKTGHAALVSLEFTNVRIKASSLKIVPGEWTMEDASITLSRSARPAYDLEARHVTIHPGVSGRADHAFLNLFGTHLGPIAHLNFSLDRRVQGLTLPNLTNRRGVGFGINWFSSVLLSDYSSLSSQFQSYPKQLPNFALTYAFSPLDPGSDPLSIAPSSDLVEIADSGWFDNISVKTPALEQETLRSKRKSFSITTAWNLPTLGRKPDVMDVSKAAELAAELGGEYKDFGYILTGRLQRIRGTSTGPWVDRAVFQSTLAPAPINLMPGVQFVARGDAFLTASSRGDYRGLRAEFGLILEPAKSLRIGAALVSTKGLGPADFEFDHFPTPLAYHFRADWVSGPYTLRFLQKYDLKTHEWYDREYEIALAAESFEPFIVSRKFPSDFRIGIRFKIDAFTDQLKKRKPRRKGTP